MSEMAIFQHLNFAETFAVAPLGVRFKFEMTILQQLPNPL
jgi:hypothetical protein